jgi:hypothetical protein
LTRLHLYPSKIDLLRSAAAILAGLLLLASPSHAGEEKKPLTASQQRMVDCNKDATGMKGDARKTFMRDCMQADKASTSAQNRMKTCNAMAGERRGDARKAFMSECLKKK